LQAAWAEHVRRLRKGEQHHADGWCQKANHDDSAVSRIDIDRSLLPEITNKKILEFKSVIGIRQEEI
jgi:hypothetical protein